MSEVDDDMLITDLSIPGTHDSGATHSLFDVAGKCQDVSIKRQLNIGVRFLDLRLQLVGDEFKIVHSFVDQNLDLIDVLDDINDFIEKNNEEFIIISIKKDADDKNPKVQFEDELVKILKSYSNISLDNSLPKSLGEARGKIYILSRYEMEIGIPAYSGWVDDDSFKLNNMFIQDNYSIDTKEEKIEDIKYTLEYAKTSNDLVLNFTSCYLNDAFPPTYAGTIASIINPWFIEYIDNNDKLGIIVADFITCKMAQAIYRRNIK